MRRVVAAVSVLALTLVLVAGRHAVAAQEASPAASPAALTPVLEAWLTAFNAGDAERLLALLTDDAVWEEPAIGLAAHGPEQIRTHLAALFTATPDIAYEVTGGVVTDEYAVVEWVVTGTYQRDFLGLPPAAGQPFTFRGVSVFELTNGHVRRYTEYWDAYTFLVQLGALPAPSPGAPSTPTP
jgi:steroid delta-isomerase-like uncharacterized protein